MKRAIYRAAAGLGLVAVFFGLAFAVVIARGATGFKHIQLTGGIIYGPDAVARISLSDSSPYITITSTTTHNGNLTVNGALTATSVTANGVTNNGNSSVTGTLSVTGNTTATGGLVPQVSTAPRSATVGVTPAAVGALVFNTTDFELCGATGTTKFTWVEVSSGVNSGNSANLSPCKH